MLEEADRLGRLVDTLLMLSRADAGHLRLSPERVDLGELVREVVNHLAVLAEEKGQSLSLETLGTIEVSVDRLVLRQAAINLLDNAIKYSPERSRIRVVVRKYLAGASVEVIDSGPGIGPDHTERIFDRFYRIDKARSRELGGTGLGLSIARWGVEVHGGKIEVESQEGLGSTFRILLPISGEASIHRPCRP
jgi:signal transduction histidine kinase